MSRELLRVFFSVSAALLVIGLTQSDGLAKGKKGGESAPAGGDMTFEPETVERKDADPPASSAPPTQRKRRGAELMMAKAGPASKTLERGLKLYDGQDYRAASIELNKVIEGQSRDDEGNKQRAEFFMGRALFNMKYYSASLSYFDHIVQKGPSHRYYQKTLQWLAALSKFLPESAGVLEKIGKYTREDLDQPALAEFRDELYYLLGRYHYSKGSFNEAVPLFASIPEKSEYFPKAKFFEGITYVRENKGKEASDSFKAILRKVKSYADPDKVPKVLKDFEELANLSLGRIFYTTKQFQQSIKYFEKLPQQSPDWLPSIFEASWAYFQLDGDSKALGNIHSVNSPFFESEFYPESYVLKAVIYFSRCNYDRSREAIDEFNALYPPLRKELDQLVAKHPDNAEFFNYVQKIQSGEAGLSTRVQRAAAGALADRTLAKNIEYVAELDRELKAIDKSDPAWKSSAIAGTVLQDLTLQRSLAQNEAGQLARQRLQRLSDEIRELTKQAIKVEFETLNAMKGALTAGLVDEQKSGNPKAKDYNTIAIDDEHQQWPFKGEYWKDELGFYRFRVQNKCGR